MIRSMVKTTGSKLPKCDAQGFHVKARPQIPESLREVCEPLFSVLEKLREHPSTRDIPAVVLSAKALPEDIQAGLDRGARAYFVKPFDVLRLEERLDDILDGRDTGEPVPD